MTGRVPAVTVSPETVRRLAVAKQHLSGTVSASPGPEDVLSVIRDLGCVQLDPIQVVAPSHLIVLWSRLGKFPSSALDQLLWKDRRLFEYWGHEASIVLTEDYPLYSGMMRGDPEAMPQPWRRSWRTRAERWFRSHGAVREYVLRQLTQRGPLLSRDFDHPKWSKRKGAGWGANADISNMLELLYLRGEVMVAGRVGRQRRWDLAERCLPAGVSKKQWLHADVEYAALQRSLRALGVASPAEIRYHFLRHRYPRATATLDRLVSESRVVPVHVRGWPNAPTRYLHADDLPLLDQLSGGGWQPRTTLLSPFDNLICDRERTTRVFGFRFLFEGYVPKSKRIFGAYTLPILRGDRLIGRIDPLVDRERGMLLVQGVHPEPRAPRDVSTATEIGDAVRSLADFVGVREVTYSGKIPSFWKRGLR